MARPSGPKTRNGGTWTEAKFKSFITSNLRMTSRKWEPLYTTMKAARVERGLYLCAGCQQTVPPTFREGRKRVQNVFVDHIDPIVDPSVGFTTWDEYIDRMFCERENLQVLCKECHDKKSQEETQIAKERRANGKDI